MYVEALKPISLLSLTLQKGGADIVTSIENTLKSVKALKFLSELAPIEWPTVKLVKKRLKDAGDQKEYQGVPLQNFDRTLEQYKQHCDRWTTFVDLSRRSRNVLYPTHELDSCIFGNSKLAK